MVCWFEQGGDFKSPINWNPFPVEFTEQQKSQKQPSRKSRLTFNLFLCFKSGQKKYLYYFFCKIKFTSYVNYCWKWSQKKYLLFFCKLNSLVTTAWNRVNKNIYFLGKIKFTSYYCLKSSQKKHFIFFANWTH